MRFIWILLFCQPLFSQEVRNLVFEGAGMRGIAYSGAVEVLEERGMLKNIQRVGGTSAGAITALALSLGYSPKEISQLVTSTPYKKFNDGRFLVFGGVNRMNKYYGWYRGLQFEKWIASLVRSKTGDADMTFQQLYERGYRDLYITGTSLKKQQTIVFSRENYPDMKVRDAVRISVSIPFYFEPIFLDSTGAPVYHPRNTDGLDVMVDGGILANFPIHIFDSSKYLDPTQPNRPVKNPQTVGFRIDRKDQIAFDSTGKGLAPMPIGSMNEYMEAFYSMLLENVNRHSLTREDWARTVSISDGDVRPKIKKLSKKEIATLTGNGKEATLRFLSREF